MIRNVVLEAGGSIAGWPLLAKADTGPVIWVVVAIVGALAIAGGVYYAYHVVQERKKNSHPALFHGLCQEHGLDRNRKRLLKRVVQLHSMSKPALVFVEPKWIQAAMKNPALRDKAGELRELQEQLFGQMESK